MSESSIQEQIAVFSETWRELNALYEGYARALGFSYASLYVLYTIYNEKDCTQKMICQRTFLPKQTVNAIVTAFLKQGMVELRELDTDRRHKAIRLTELGIAQADQYIPAILSAEYQAIERLSPEQRAALVELTRRYKDNMRALLPAVRAA